jgi:hypothetical protein
VHGDLEAVGGEVELGDDLPPQQRQGVGGRRGPDARPELLGDARAPGEVAALADEDVETGAGEVGGGDEAVVARAYDDGVEDRAMLSAAGPADAPPRTGALAAGGPLLRRRGPTARR